MLEPEFVAVTAQPNALERGDQETGTFPCAVVAIAVNGGHAPEVHVPDFQRSVTGHVKGPIGRAEIVVNTGIHTQLAQAEVLVGGQFKEDIVPGGGLSPIQRWLRVSGKVVVGLIPYRQAISWSG